MEMIQEQFHAAGTDTFTFVPGEYEGPLVIDHPCVVDGCHSTLWAEKGPVLMIAARDVTIKNLRVEITGSFTTPDSYVAIKTDDPNTALVNVEVHGDVIGLPHEPERWDLPSVMNLGQFAAGRENTFLVTLQLPTAAILDSNVQDLHIVPEQLAAGRNDLVLTTSALRHNTILYGEMMIRTSVARRIYVTGKALNEAPVHQEAPVVARASSTLSVSRVVPPAEVVAPKVSDIKVTALKKGQRIAAKELNSTQIKIIYEHKHAMSDMDIDSYCFALQENGKVSCDEDLVFFGHTELANHSLKVGSSDWKPMVLVELDKIDARVSRIAVCYSIYGDDVRQNFSMVSEPLIRIFGGNREVFRFELKGLSQEKTVVAVEIYRYKGEWKINLVGAGYRKGIQHLCESYGVCVE